MNEIIKNILSRQTIREYTAEQVPDELLNIILDWAIRAPSGRNSQPCHLRIVQDRELLDRMNTDFKNIVQSNRMKIPFGVAQVGKSFRNEIIFKNCIFVCILQLVKCRIRMFSKVFLFYILI